MSGAGRRTEGLVSIAVLASSVAFFIWRALQLGPGLAAELSDSLALARSFSVGHGLRWTEASSVVAGPPNAVWFAVQGVVAWAGGAFEIALPRVAILLGAVTLGLVGLRGALVGRRWPQLEEMVPMAALSGATVFCEAAARGSPMVSRGLALAAVVVLLARHLGTGRSAQLGAVVGALTLFSPSAVWCLLAAVPAWWLAARLAGRPASAETGWFVGAGGCAVAVIIGARWWLVAEVPTEGVWPADRGVDAMVLAVERHAAWFWIAGGAVLVSAVWRRFHLQGGGTVTAWVVVAMVVASWSDVPGWFVGVLPLLAMLVADGLTSARERATRKDTPTLARLAWVALALMVAVTSLAARRSFNVAPTLEVAPEATKRDEVVAELARRGVRQPLVVWGDGAEAARLFPDARVVVLHSSRATVEDLLVSEGPPDLVDGRLVLDTMPRLLATVAAGPGAARWLIEQSADDDPRCADGRLALLDASPEQVIDGLWADIRNDRPQAALARWRCALSALDCTHLPDVRLRAPLIAELRRRADGAASTGALENAVRWSSLMTELAEEPARMRADTERLRRRWLEN